VAFRISRTHYGQILKIRGTVLAYFPRADENTVRVKWDTMGNEFTYPESVLILADQVHMEELDENW
jgi:hypothetical protein